ncbi:8000_t:CDS:2 [Funneliformis mosseae]|uniref:8000_t:CDS:1 n=1 Tax=Funneliformis mosseae TaxID=27381 RepID=A0A9N9HLG3_FUNMO|nr:8000_t:CDS:2 [Funneliformis mosseae]
MVDIKLTCRLFRDIEANSEKFNIDINTSKTVNSLKKKIFEEVQKKNDKIFSGIKVSNLELWMVHIRGDDEFSLKNDSTEGIKELEEKISDYWDDKNLPEEGFTNVIIDSSLLTALKRLEQYEGASDYIIPNIHRAGFQDLYYAKIIRINDVLQIDKKYSNTKIFIQYKVVDFDAGTLFVHLIDDKEQRKEGFFHIGELEKWLIGYSILGDEDRPREYNNSGENVEIIRNGNQELKKHHKDSTVKSELKQGENLSEEFNRLNKAEYPEEKLLINNAMMLCNCKVSRVKDTNLFNRLDDTSNTF